MPRQARHIIPQFPVHIVQRGNNRQPCFYDSDDYATYLKWLREYALETRAAIHAYVLMTNHIHLLMTCDSADGAGKLMKALSQRYTQYLNRRYDRSGSPWEARYRSSIIQAEFYLLACHRYIELNPVRACMVKVPEQYRWSSFHSNGTGGTDSLLRPHAIYLGLGQNASERQAAYRALFEDRLPDSLVRQFGNAVQANRNVGNAKFAAEIEAVLKGAPGRRSS